MPELPEVETTVQGLKNRIIGKKIVDVWTDWPKYFRGKTEKSFRRFVLGKIITKVSRRGKNILIELDINDLILIHQKLSGHLLIGNWVAVNSSRPDFGVKWQNQKWVPAVAKVPEGSPGASLNHNLRDEKNRFIRFIIKFNGNDMLALSDVRRFAKVLFGTKEEIFSLPEIKSLGPDPLDHNFNFIKFKNLFNPPIGRKKGRIKQVLLDQNFIVGIGNIYADEILWDAKINPFFPIERLNETHLKSIYKSTKKILKKAVELGGTSIDDYRDPGGGKGRFGKTLKAYQQTGKSCRRCKTPIERIKLGIRSTHFCPKCQQL